MKIETIAVHAANKDLRALRHEPSGEGFDEHGNGIWPADQFTFRLLAEGAIKRREERSGEPAAASASKGK